MRTGPALALALLLLACGKPDNAAGPGGVTVGEAKALDEAAEMVEARRLPTETITVATPVAQPAQTRSAPAPVGTAQPKP